MKKLIFDENFFLLIKMFIFDEKINFCFKKSQNPVNMKKFCDEKVNDFIF